MRYRLSVTYQAGNTQVHDKLDTQQAESGLFAFGRDLFTLEGRGVRRLTLEIEPQLETEPAS